MARKHAKECQSSNSRSHIATKVSELLAQDLPKDAMVHKSAYACAEFPDTEMEAINDLNQAFDGGAESSLDEEELDFHFQPNNNLFQESERSSDVVPTSTFTDAENTMIISSNLSLPPPPPSPSPPPRPTEVLKSNDLAYLVNMTDGGN